MEKPPRRYLNPKESAEYISVSLRTFRDLLARREIPYIQPSGKGGLVRVDILDLDSFMARYKVDSIKK